MPHNGERGFTLIEALVALAIAALGLVAVFAAAGGGLESVDIAQRYVAATRAAQTHLAEVGTAIPLADGDIGGLDAGGLRWRVRMKPVQTRAGEDAAVPSPTLYAVESVVSWGAVGSGRSVRLESLRVAAPEKGPRR